MILSALHEEAENMRREYSIYRTLKAVSKQRVAFVAQPGNAWAIERSVSHTETNEANLRTCHLRGWVEPIVDALPFFEVGEDLKIPQSPAAVRPLYRLTDGGWNAIHRTRVLALLGVLISLVGLCATIMALVL